MTWNIRTNVTQEEVDRYITVVVEFIEEYKGWKPGEYQIRFITALEDAPLAAFNTIHYDGLKELTQNPPQSPGIHPLEVQVYINTDEMRAFTSVEEFHRVLNEARKKKAGE